MSQSKSVATFLLALLETDLCVIDLSKKERLFWKWSPLVVSLGL